MTFKNDHLGDLEHFYFDHNSNLSDTRTGSAAGAFVQPRQKFMTANSSTIKLDQFLKLVGIAPTGGQAKLLIQNGDVLVNDTLETRRGRKLVSGDRVTVGGQTFAVELESE